MAIVIARERPDSLDAVALIAELDNHLDALYPGSHNGLSVAQLISEDAAFFVLRDDGAAVGCGALRFRDGYAELKRMYVRPAFRGRSLGRQMLEHLIESARETGYSLLRLETGIYQAEAIGLYERLGFVPTGPFGNYPNDPLCCWYEKRL